MFRISLVAFLAKSEVFYCQTVESVLESWNWFSTFIADKPAIELL